MLDKLTDSISIFDDESSNISEVAFQSNIFNRLVKAHHISVNAGKPVPLPKIEMGVKVANHFRVFNPNSNQIFLLRVENSNQSEGTNFFRLIVCKIVVVLSFFPVISEMTGKIVALNIPISTGMMRTNQVGCWFKPFELKSRLFLVVFIKEFFSSR